MVIDNNTLKPLHNLTEDGKIAYTEFLEYEADRMIMKKNHPLIYILKECMSLFNIDNELINREYEKIKQSIENTRQ